MPFKSGKSGNPKGRPPENLEVQALAKKHTVESVNRLVHWMRSDNAKASCGASVALLDRAWGKPAQALTGPDGTGPVKLLIQWSDDE